MVKRRHQKYITESSDESDSDDDFYEEDVAGEAAPKKYGLRQRRSANFAEDFEYDVGEENDTNILAGSEVLRSDDEDFELRNAQQKNLAGESIPKTEVKQSETNLNCTVTKYKEREIDPEIPTSRQSSDNMIDFEDVIRADILVNQSRIDYDSIIEKSEIKMIEKPQPTENVSKVVKTVKGKKSKEPPKKRGRRKSKKAEDEYNQDNSTGLPINAMLGVTESLYELAERYHLQGGMMEDEMVSLPLEPIINENISPGNDFLVNNNEVPVQQSDPAAGAIQIY